MINTMGQAAAVCDAAWTAYSAARHSMRAPPRGTRTRAALRSMSGQTGTEQLERFVEKLAEASAPAGSRPHLGCHVECGDGRRGQQLARYLVLCTGSPGRHFRERRPPAIALLQQPPT